MNDSFEMVAKTFFGLENVLAQEIKDIGGKGIEVLNRAVKPPKGQILHQNRL